MMVDLISRQDAIDALSENIEDCFVLHDAIKAIQEVPSAQPKFPEDEICGEGETAAYKEGWNDAIDTYAQRWIPCSERLPEEGKMVLTTTIGTDIVVQHDNESFEEAIERSMRSPIRVSIGFIGSDGWYGADWFPSIISPSAWMPLPEPYKGENNE